MISVIALTIFSIVTQHKSNKTDDMLVNNITSMSSSSEKNISSHLETSNSGKIVVDIKGNIKKPGIYTMKTGMRISQVIDLAEGFLSNADQKQINLAQKVTDEMVIYVPAKGEVKENKVAATTTVQGSSVIDAGSSSAGTQDKSNDEATINLNTATKEQLQGLTGIGPKKAEQILQYREEHQSFKTTDELKEVGGIGDKTYESLKDSLAV